MKKRLLSILLMCCMVLTLLPTAAFAEGSEEELPVCTCETSCTVESMNDDCPVCGAEGASAENCAKYLLSLYTFVRGPEAQIQEDTVEEQFTLTPGGTYYFDLSSANIPGTANGSLPDSTLHYVPFTYAGTIEAYKLTSAMATTEEYAQQNKYPHSLFVADYAVTHTVSWNGLNDEGLIFGKNYASGGVDYTLRAPSVGSNATGSGDSQRGVPQSNEWDTMLNKNSGYIKNWNGIYSWGQDTTRYNSSFRAVRGFISARLWGIDNAASSDPNVVFRPVLEILNPDTLGSDGLKVVTLDLGGGTLGNSSEDIQIIVKTGSEFTAPASDGMTRPNGDTGSYFMWLGSDGKLYAPGASVPADVTKLTAQFALSEQFSLTPGGTYYFDLSAMGIPGTVNDALPDNTLHYVPFTYAGTADAYKLMSEMATTEEYAKQNKYPHSLFVADYAVTHTVSWDDLNTKSLIFGKDYAAGGVGYTLRAPSCGSGFTDSGDSERGTPQSNEWDAVLNKNSGYIQNWNQMYSWGQDAYFGNASDPAVRGYYSARTWSLDSAAFSTPNVGFRPVLEILNPDALGSDGLKVVTLDLGGGTLGGSSDAIQIIVKTGSEFTAPASDGMTRPNGDTGSYFMWLGSDGKLYAPGGSVPADVTKLTAQFALSEQFSLAPGGRYYFDLSAMNIPGKVNSELPDSTLHYVPFTYVGTVNAYKLTTERATTEEYAQREKYPHSLFIADYNVTFNVDWNQLNEKQMIFGTPYTSYGVNYTMRAPSAGSQSNNGKDDSSTRGIPKSNEWDAILDKANQDWKDNISGYIKNWSGKYSFGQDNYAASYRAYRGYFSARFWGWSLASTRHPDLGFRPVLEVLNPDTLDSDGLKVVTLDLGGGKLGGSSDAIHIIVKTGSKFTAPASDGMTRPDGNTGSFFMWLGSDGKLYAPGAIVPAEVTKLTVQWTAPTYAVTLNTNGGTIADGKDVTGYTYGVGATLPTDVTRTGYTFKGWYDNEGLTGDPVTAIGNTETGNKEYWAKWEINQYTITVKPENGKADITITQDYGTPITAPTLTREGYQFNGWDKTFPTTMPAENLTITAQWRYNGGGGSGYSYYTIKATAGAGGSISPSGNVSVREGRDQTFTITPDKGYAVANVKIDGKSIGAVKSYTFENVSRTHTIEVIFMKANGNPQTGVFVDVATGSYYEDAVDWAVENGITKGTDDTHFSPDGICTRAQAVTFLWRAAGSPKPETRAMPFTDVPVGSYYYDAVLWAVENGITNGTSETRFSPNMTCSRAQIVAFLWRSEKSPAAGTANPFADVKSTAYYAGAVLWAVKENITKGTTNTTFSPDADCTRAQIVTFLWRCKK